MRFHAEIIGDESLIKTLKQMGPDVKSAMQDSIGVLVLRLATKVQKDKLSGQVLNVRSGRLRRSISSKVSVGGNMVTGIAGTNVEYARKHEYGFDGIEHVSAHLRLIKQAFGKSLRSPVYVQVRSHPRDVAYPAHSFMRTALEGMRTEIIQILDRDYKSAVRRGMA